VINESILGASLIRLLKRQSDRIRQIHEANAEARDIGLSFCGCSPA